MLKYIKNKISKIDKKEFKEKAIIVGSVALAVVATIAVFKSNNSTVSLDKEIGNISIDGVTAMTLNAEELYNLPANLCDNVITVIDHLGNVGHAIDISLFDMNI